MTLYGRDHSEKRARFASDLVIRRDWRAGVRRIRVYRRGRILTREERERAGIHRHEEIRRP